MPLLFLVVDLLDYGTTTVEKSFFILGLEKGISLNSNAEYGVEAWPWQIVLANSLGN